MKQHLILGTVLGAALGLSSGFGLAIVYLSAQDQGEPSKTPEGRKHPDEADKGAGPNDRDKDLKIVGEVVRTVQKRALRPLNASARRQLIEDMINGGLVRLDPYATYLNPRHLREFDKKHKGRFGGIGVQVHTDPRTGLIRVISPIVGTPAYNAGIQAGDYILKVDGKSAENMTLDEAVDKITGAIGEPVVLTVLHEGDKKPVEVRIVRAVIEVESVLGDRRKPDNLKEWDFMYDKENKIAYLRLTAFSQDTGSDLAGVLGRLHKEGMRGLVLDLRYNPGGLLRAAVEVSNLFLEGGQVIVRIRDRSRNEEVFKARRALTLLPSARELPVAVLINRGSASASEIVALALQDHKRAVIVGERSFGKGSVQSVIVLADKASALKLTTAGYFSPLGRSIHRFPDSKETDAWGVKPDAGFQVLLKDPERLEYLRYRYERDIVPNKKAQPVKPDDKKAAKKPPFVDRVLEKALDFLRGEIHQGDLKKGA